MTNDEAATIIEQFAASLRQGTGRPCGGAFIAVPPEGDPVDWATITSSPDAPLFWAGVEGKIEQAKALLIMKDEEANRFMGMRR